MHLAGYFFHHVSFLMVMKLSKSMTSLCFLQAEIMISDMILEEKKSQQDNLPRHGKMSRWLKVMTYKKANTLKKSRGRTSKVNQIEDNLFLSREATTENDCLIDLFLKKEGSRKTPVDPMTRPYPRFTNPWTPWSSQTVTLFLVSDTIISNP